jgi:hypothetical protein
LSAAKSGGSLSATANPRQAARPTPDFAALNPGYKSRPFNIVIPGRAVREMRPRWIPGSVLHTAAERRSLTA